MGSSGKRTTDLPACFLFSRPGSQNSSLVPLGQGVDDHGKTVEQSLRSFVLTAEANPCAIIIIPCDLTSPAQADNTIGAGGPGGTVAATSESDAEIFRSLWTEEVGGAGDRHG